MTKDMALDFAAAFRTAGQDAFVFNTHGDAYGIAGPTYAVRLNGNADVKTAIMAKTLLIVLEAAARVPAMVMAA